MTSERDFDRLARAWLELGPDEAPDRVVAAVLQAAETTPQVRRPMRWPSWRSFDMTRLPLVAGAAAVLVVVIGGGVLLTRGNDPGPGGVIASPSLIATPAATRPASPSAATPVPAALRARWMGGPRVIAGLDARAGSSITFKDDGAFWLAPSNQNLEVHLPSVASSPDVGLAGSLRLETVTTADTLCANGAVGSYTWVLSPSGRILTVGAADDDCPARLATVPGSWWKADCKNPDDDCLGDLDAATYQSQYIDPRTHPGAAWAPIFGGLRYTVPAGWANSADWPSEFELVPSTEYAAYTAAGAPDGHSFDIWVGTKPVAEDATCDAKESTLEPRTVDGLIGHLVGSKALTTTAPQAIEIDGHPGKWVDIALAPTWTQTCPDAPALRTVSLFREAGTTSGWDYGFTSNGRARVIVVDLGGGDLVLFSIDSSDATRFDDLVARAMPVVATFTFK